MSVVARALGSRYELDEQIGSGAMGDVWRALDRTTGELVAAKILHDRFAADVGVVTRFLQERTILLALDHPNVVRVRDLVVVGNQLAIVMDLVEGSDLRKLLRREGVLAPAVAAGLAADALDALAHAHAMSVLHRDVKPDNILLDAGEPPRARLSDFGIARLAQETTVRMTGLLGTAEYIAPEILTGTVSAASDVYGAGATLYELLAGFTPFAGSDGAANPYAIARRHETAEPPPIDGLPDRLWRLVATMLAKAPAERPAAAAAAAELRRLAPELAGLAALPRRQPPDSWADAAGGGPGGQFVIRSAPVDSELLDPHRTIGGELPSTAAALPVAGPAVAAPRPAPADMEAAPLTQLGEQLAPRPVVDVPVFEPVAQQRSGLRTWQKAAIGVAVAGVVGAAGVAVAAATRSGGGSDEADAPQVSRITATAPVRNHPTGLTVQRSATYDEETGRISVSVTWDSTAAVSGPFLESVPATGPGTPCPAVLWEGGVLGIPDPTDGLPATACAQRVDVATVGPGRSAKGTYSFPAKLEGPDLTAALTAYLNKAQTEAENALGRLGVSPAYPVQRLVDLDVQVVSPPVEGTLVSVLVTPVWTWTAQGDRPVDNVNALFDSERGGRSALLEKLGGRNALALRSDDCSAALIPNPAGLIARNAASGCTVTAQLGNIDERSGSFTIAQRDS